MASLNTSVSLRNPTWEYLHSNYTKIDLQKHCREIGITQIWVTKEKLIDKILEIHQSSRPKDFENSVQTQETTSRNTRDEIQELRERVSIRDSEIDKLNELLISANATISEMNDRLSLVEEQMRKLQVHSGTQQTPSICRSEFCLFTLSLLFSFSRSLYLIARSCVCEGVGREI